MKSFQTVEERRAYGRIISRRHRVAHRKELREYHRDYYHRKVKVSPGYAEAQVSKKQDKHEYDVKRNLERRELILKDHYCEICGVSIKGERRWKWCIECAPAGKKIKRHLYYVRIGKWKSKRGPDWELQKQRALHRDHHRCRCCGGTHRLSVHHIREYAGLPTDNELWNLVTLCSSCHSRGHRCKVFYWN